MTSNTAQYHTALQAALPTPTHAHNTPQGSARMLALSNTPTSVSPAQNRPSLLPCGRRQLHLAQLEHVLQGIHVGQRLGHRLGVGAVAAQRRHGPVQQLVHNGLRAAQQGGRAGASAGGRQVKVVVWGACLPFSS